jgi:hypothetical protein
LGFEKKDDISMGEFRWLTVVSPQWKDGMELVLEPNVNPTAKNFQEALFEQSIPATSFVVTEIQTEFDRLKAKKVVFTTPPEAMEGGPTIAVFDDTCGNLIQLVQL